ncbi:unnamed protein product, partial [Musa acuminata subsp. burmannicoides]
MDPVDVVPSGYRFLPTAEELVVDYLANCVAGTPLPSRAVAFADVYGTEPWNLLCNDRQEEGYFFAERKPKNSGGSRVDRRAGTGSWTLNKSKNPSSPSSTGARWWWDERASLLQRWPAENSGWNMYEYEMCSPGFERRVLCHVKKSSHHAISGGNFIKKKPAHSLQSDVSPPPTAVVQHPISARAVTPPESRLSSVDSVAPNEAGVPSAALSSTDVGGGELVITAEELEEFLASPSPSIDLGGEQ